MRMHQLTESYNNPTGKLIQMDHNHLQQFRLKMLCDTFLKE